MTKKMCEIANQIIKKSCSNEMKQDCIKECEIAIQEAFCGEKIFRVRLFAYYGAEGE